MVAAEAVVMPRVRRCGGCDGREDGTVEAMLQWQKVSDMLIAASLLSIPLELLYFATRGALAPLRRALLQLGTFIVLCGVTHLINVLSYDHPGSRRVLLALTAAKLLGALASSTAAASLPVFFPRLLRLKVREAFLHAKARRLDRDLDAVRRREETTWRVVRALTHDTCVSADARTVLRTTVLQLAAALGLHNCAVWMPRRGACDGVLWLVHQLLPEDVEAPRALDSSTRVISILDPDVAAIMTGKDAKVLRPGSALEAASGGGLPPGGAAAAIRLPMLRVSNFDVGNTSELASCAILVLVLPPNDHHRSPAGWNNQDLEIVQAVAYQVAVALSQAVAMEESQLIRHKLAEQHGALLHVKDELVAATKARNAAHSVMRDTMRRPMHSVIGLLSVMQQEATTTMRPEQRLTIDAIARTSTLSATLMDDAMEMLSTTVAAVENRELALFSPHQVARRPSELRSLIRDAASAAGCLSRCRGLSFSHQLEANSLPKWVVGDDRRVFHLLLHMVDALLSRCCRHVAGLVLSFSVCNCNTIVGEDQDWILVQPNFSGGNQVFVKFQVGLTRSTESDPGSLPASCPLPCSADSGGTGRPSIAIISSDDEW